MNFLRSVLHYASAAWSLVWGTVTDPAEALQAIWHFTGSVQTLVGHLFAAPSREILSAMLFYISIADQALQEYLGAIRRIAGWIWAKQVNPVRISLANSIARLKAWTLAWISKLIAMIVTYYWASLRYANNLVATERAQRIAAVNAARAYAAALAKSALATVQREASTGYNSQTRQRESVIEKIAADLVARNPLVKDAVAELVRLVVDAAEIDDPLINIALNLALKKVIDTLGVDRVAGDLLSTLIGELTGNRPPSTLQGVTADIAVRLGALESQWADFMAAGGPEVEQAGREWKSYASLAADAALIAFFAQAAADPAGWAREVNGTAGAAVNATFTVVSDLIKGA